MSIIGLTGCKKKTTEPSEGNGGSGLGSFHLRIWTINKNADSVEYAKDTLKYLLLRDWIYDRTVWDEFDTIIPVNKEVYFYNGNYLQLVIELDLPIGVKLGEGIDRDYGCQSVSNGIEISFRNVPDTTNYTDNTGEVKYKDGTIKHPAFYEFTTRGFFADPNDPDWAKKGDTIDIAIIYDWSAWSPGLNEPYREGPFKNPFDQEKSYAWFTIIDPDTFPSSLIAKGRN